MTDQLVQIPASLLLSPDLLATAKLLWMVARLRPVSGRAGPTWLANTSGLSRPTVAAGMNQLAALGWGPSPAGVCGPTVPVPATLLTNRHLGVHARTLYGVLMLTPGFRHPGGRLTFAELARLAHAGRNTVARALDQLVQAEWIRLERANRLAPVEFELTFPGRARAEIALAQAQRRLSKAQHYGEGLMREFLSLIVDSEAYQDNANPGFLVSPRTQELLQFDRYYPPNVAFEFNGPQHYRATARFTAEESARQRERDLIKMGICMTRGINLVLVHPEDLSLQTMRQKVGNLLPLRPLTGNDLLIEFLEAEGRRYGRRMEQI